MFTREIQIGRLSFQARNRTIVLSILCVFLLIMGVVGRLTRSDGGGSYREAPLASVHDPYSPSQDAAMLRAAVREGLKDSARKESSTDPLYFLDGIWVTGNEPCVRCNLGPGVAAAALGRLESDDHLVRMAIRTIDPAIRQHRLPNGAFGPPAPGETGVDIQTSQFGVQLGLALYALGPDLDERHRDSWTEALRGATEFLIDNGNFNWYTNGNITLANAALAALTWHATGDTRYQTVFEQGLAFATAPPAERWPGRGLVLTRQATRPDGADGAGYLTEAGGDNNIGFDADYTQVQADLAATAAMVTNNPDALRLANLLVNQLLPRVNRTTWLLDTSQGTRHPLAGRTVPFTTSALAVLAGRGRDDLADLVGPQSEAMATYVVADRAKGAYQLWGSRLAPALLSLR